MDGVFRKVSPGGGFRRGTVNIIAWRSMQNHTYTGKFEDGVYQLFTDGVPERFPPGGFRWGDEPDSRSYATATRILAREIPIPAVFRYYHLFDTEIMPTLPTSRQWAITSEGIRRWMRGESIHDEEA